MFKKLLLTSAFSLALLPGMGAANAADLGGDCCADLEERVATLEATTARKGNRKVSLTISGWVSHGIMAWDDGEESDVYVTGDTTDLASNISFAGSAKINHDLSAGYHINIFFDDATSLVQSQADDDAGFGVTVQRSNWWIKSEQLGKITVGLQSDTGDNVAILADFSGTLFPANNVIFDGAFFSLRPEGGTGLVGANWAALAFCNSIGFGIASDCNGFRTNVVRYDSPTIAGFNLSASWGEDDNYNASIAYKGKWQDLQVSAAVGYGIAHANEGVGQRSEYLQIGAMVKHLPSNLWVYGSWDDEDTDGGFASGNQLYLKAGWSPKLNSLGTTHFWVEYGLIEDRHGAFAFGNNTCNSMAGGVSTNLSGAGGNIGAACIADTNTVITGSEVTRWGVGIQQQIDAASMQIYAKWRQMEGEVDFSNSNGTGTQDFEAIDMFIAGGVIFF
jgi:predicted porin